MISGVFLFTLKLLCTVFGSVLLLRAYLRFSGTPGNDPIHMFTHQLTQWVVQPAASFIPRLRNWDLPSIFVAYLVAVIYQFFFWMVGGFGIGIERLVLGSFVLVLYWGVELAMWLALLYCILSWVNPTSPYYRTLGYLTDPFLAPFRKLIPTWRNIDFSAIVFFILVSLVSSFLVRFI